MNLLSSWMLLQVWGHLAPLAIAEAPDTDPPPSLDPATPDTDPSPNPDPSPFPPPDLTPQVVAQSGPVMDTELIVIPVVPPIMGWLGSIGGVLGIISFTDTYLRKLFGLFKPRLPSAPPTPPEKHDAAWFTDFENRHRQVHNPKWPVRVAPKKEKDEEAPWKVGIQVGLDGSGLQGAGGDFPQICLWNVHGQLIGYNDQTIHVADAGFREHEAFNSEGTREDIPEILSGGLKAIGIWPAPGLEERRAQQAVYVTMIKRHFDAICVASVFIQSPDDSKWCFDGSWARASNMSWFYSFIVDSDRDHGECFWLDHRGDLKHTKDLEEEYIGAYVKELGTKPKKDYPDWLYASKVLPEAGIPEGADLTKEMRLNGVHDYKVPLGVKFHGPQFTAGNYDANFDGLTIPDFVENPAKIKWIMEPMRKNVRGGNPALPILHPQANLSEKNPEVIWEDVYNQDIPVDCMTDWYYDKDDVLVEPGDHERCVWIHSEAGKVQIQRCRDKNFVDPNYPKKKGDPRRRRSFDDDPAGDHPPPPLHERHARTLVNDKNRRRGGISTKELCESPHSVGPSYANHHERFFCRMTDKTLWPFCDGDAGVLHDCFDAEAEVLVEKNRPIGKRAHHWDAIEDWHSGERFKRAA